MISPITVGLVVGAGAVARLVTGSWLAALLAGLFTWVVRVLLSSAMIETDLDQAVGVTWEVARRGQQLTDARRRIDIAALDRTLESTPADDPRHTAAAAQKASHGRLRSREERTREQLEILDARLDETIVRAGELATRTGGSLELDELAGQITGMVDELDALRLALDEVGNET